jgi:hypothetical protein
MDNDSEYKCTIIGLYRVQKIVGTTHIALYFCFVCLRLVFGVPYAANFPGFSICDCPSGFSSVY